jgi:hypothetical protein
MNNSAKKYWLTINPRMNTAARPEQARHREYVEKAVQPEDGEHKPEKNAP